MIEAGFKKFKKMKKLVMWIILGFPYIWYIPIVHCEYGRQHKRAQVKENIFFVIFLRSISKVYFLID